MGIVATGGSGSSRRGSRLSSSTAADIFLGEQDGDDGVVYDEMKEGSVDQEYEDDDHHENAQQSPQRQEVEEEKEEEKAVTTITGKDEGTKKKRNSKTPQSEMVDSSMVIEEEPWACGEYTHPFPPPRPPSRYQFYYWSNQ